MLLFGRFLVFCAVFLLCSMADLISFVSVTRWMCGLTWKECRQSAETRELSIAEIGASQFGGLEGGLTEMVCGYMECEDDQIKSNVVQRWRRRNDTSERSNWMVLEMMWKVLSVLHDVLVRNKLEGKATNLGLPGKTDTRLTTSFSGTAWVNWHQNG